jgi:hypothetical protein
VEGIGLLSQLLQVLGLSSVGYSNFNSTLMYRHIQTPILSLGKAFYFLEGTIVWNMKG